MHVLPLPPPLLLPLLLLTPWCPAVPVAFQDAEVSTHVGTLQRGWSAEPVLDQLTLLRQQHEEASELPKTEASGEQANRQTDRQTAAERAAATACVSRAAVMEWR
jgi:hypothetical protein